MQALLIKLGKQLVVTLVTDEKKRNHVLILICALIAVTFIIPICTLSLPGILLKDAFSIEEGPTNIEDFSFEADSLQNNKMYIKIRDSYIKYLDNLEYDFDAKIEKIKEDNTYEKVIEENLYDLNGNIIGTEVVGTETVVPEVIKQINIAKPELRHLMAYIGVKYQFSQTADDNYRYDEKEALQFLQSITTFQEQITGTDPIYYKAWTSIIDIRSISEMYFNEMEYENYQQMQDMYISSFDSMEDFSDDLVGNVYEFIDLNTLNVHENGMAIPHLLQYDPKWGKEKYGTSTIAKSGCAIASMAMIQSYFSGKGVLPTSIANWSSSRGYYYPGQGTAWSFFPAYSSEIGLVCNNLGKNVQAIISALENSKPVLASMAPGTFTRGGHFIVLRGITKEGKLLVNDPNDNYHSKKFYEREFDFNLVYNEAKNFWSFSQ